MDKQARRVAARPALRLIYSPEVVTVSCGWCGERVRRDDETGDFPRDEDGDVACEPCLELPRDTQRGDRGAGV